MAKEFTINGLIIDHSGLLTDESVMNLFVSWTEAHGLLFAGKIMESDIPINKIEQDEFNDDICCGGNCSCGRD